MPTVALALSGDGRQFWVDEIPAGHYTVRTWRELLGSVDYDVVVKAGNDPRIDIDLQAAAPETP